MRLIDLEPQFVRFETRIEKWTRVLGDPLTWKPGDPTEEVEGPRVYHVKVDTLAEAQGVRFLCPGCFAKNKGPVGTHCCLVWFDGRGVPPEAEPGPGRWKVMGGLGYHDLTLAPSILIPDDWHGHITVGNVA